LSESSKIPLFFFYMTPFRKEFVVSPVRGVLPGSFPFCSPQTPLTGLTTNEAANAPYGAHYERGEDSRPIPKPSNASGWKARATHFARPSQMRPFMRGFPCFS